MINFSCETCNSNFETRNASNYTKRFSKVLLVGTLITMIVVSVLAGVGFFSCHSSLPHWLAHAVGTIGHTGCLVLFLGGSGLSLIGIAHLVSKISCKKKPSVGEIIESTTYGSQSATYGSLE